VACGVGLADEALLPVGRANRGAFFGLLPLDKALRLLVIELEDSRDRSTPQPQPFSPNGAKGARTRRGTEGLGRLGCSW
jgi:hypothetical protein